MFSHDPAGRDSGIPRRILGMKIWQVAVLLGMAVMECVVLVAGAVIIFGSLPSAASGSAAGLPVTAPPPAGPTLSSNPSPAPSETPVTLIFQFPTFTPFGTPPPTLTPTATATELMTGWIRYFTPQVELWMPGSYAAGDPHTEAKAIIAALKEKGVVTDWEALEQEMKNAGKSLVLWGYDSRIGGSGILTEVQIAYDFPNPGEPLADYAVRFLGAVSDIVQVIEQQSLAHPMYEAQRVIMETKNVQGTPVRFALYVLRDGNVIWDVLCMTAADEMEIRLPEFNQMVQTFRVLAPSA